MIPGVVCAACLSLAQLQMTFFDMCNEMLNSEIAAGVQYSDSKIFAICEERSKAQASLLIETINQGKNSDE